MITPFLIRRILLAAAFLIPSSFAQTSFTCTAAAISLNEVRNGGRSEQVGDIQLRCEGLRPSTGLTATIEVILNNAPLTSRIFNTGNGASEALLFLDLPPSEEQLGQPVNTIVPAANVIQGAVSGSMVRFSNVPLVPIGLDTEIQRMVRITNLRANVSALQPQSILTASVRISGSQPVSVINPTVEVATVGRPLTFAVRSPNDADGQTRVIDGCAGNNTQVTAATPRDFQFRFTENHAGDFRARNIATTTQTPLRIADQTDLQGKTGFGTESGFINTQLTGSGGMNRAGIASQGTRLAARFSGLPGTARLWVTTQPVTPGTSITGITARLTLTNANGAGDFNAIIPSAGLYAQIPIVNGSALAVWEVFDPNATAQESLSFGVVLSIPANAAGNSIVSTAGFYAPVGTEAPNISSAVPLFSATNVVNAVAAEVRGCVQSLSIVTAPPLATGTIGVPLTVALIATGGTGRYNWSLAPGSLPVPPGLTLAANGVISGTPSQVGTYTFTLRVADDAGAAVSREFSMQVVGGVVITTACPLADVAQGAPFTLALAAAGGTQPYAWSILRGALPNGLILARTGTISGNASLAGAFTFTLQVMDARNSIAQRECSQRVIGPLRISPAAIRISANSGGALTIPQIVSITSDTIAQTVTARVTTSSGGNWLRVTPDSGRVPEQFEVLADPANVPAGNHQGLVTITTQGSVQHTISLAVTFDAGAPAPASLGVEPGGLVLSFPRGAPTADRIVHVVNRGNGSIDFRASIEILNYEGWVTLPEQFGTASASGSARLRLRFTPRGLDPGLYRARLRLESANPPKQLTVPIALGVTNGSEAMFAEPQVLHFTASSGASAPPSQAFQVIAVATAFNWQASVTTDTSVPRWLTLSTVAGRASQDAPSPVDVRVTTAGLPVGRHSGEIVVSAPGVDNAPRTVLAILDVIAASQNPEPVIGPQGLMFTASAGEVNPARQTVTIQNTTRNTLNVQAGIAGDSDVWAVNVLERTVAPGGTGRVEVVADISRATVSFHTARLNLQFGADPRSRSVGLSLAIGAGGVRLQTANLTQGFTILPGSGVPVDVLAHDASGAPLTSGHLTATLNGSLAPTALTHASGGRWLGTLRVPSLDPGPVLLHVFAEHANPGVNGSLQWSGTIQPSTLPFAPASGVTSPLSFQLFQPMAQGGWIALFGHRLGEEAGQTADTVPYPAALGATRVRIGAGRIPLYYAGSRVITGLIPYSLPPNAVHQIVVATTGGATITELLATEAQPSIFTANLSGAGQGIIVHSSDPLVLTDPARPAAKGESITIYAEGLGPITPPLEAGRAAPVSTPQRTVRPVRVTIGGREAVVQFAGLAPGLVGIYHVMTVVPADSATGDAVPVVITANGQSSQAVTIAVRP